MSIKLKWTSTALLGVLLTLSGPSSTGQILQSGRYETPLLESERDYYKAIPARENGILLCRKVNTTMGEQFEVARLDTTLQETWRGYVPLSPTMAHAHTFVKDDFVYFLFKSRNVAIGEFQVTMLKIENGSYTQYSIKNLIPFNPTEFTITKGSALIAGYFNYRPLILHYSFAAHQSKILPGFFNEPGELTQMKTNDDGSVDVIVSARNYEKRKSLWIRNYDAEGNIIKTTILQPEENKNLIFGRSLKMANGDQVVSGVYGRYSEYSRGIFVASVNAFGEYAIQYYSFADLQRFFNYMRASREKRVRQKIERRRVKGKKVKFNYRMLVQELIPYGNQYILLGEAFYPHYSYPGGTITPYTLNTYNRFYGIPGYRNDLVFDGYQYTHAVVIGFDKNGKLLWDNSFEINDVRSFQLGQFVNIYPQNDRIILLYLYENIIRSKIISGSNVLEGKSLDEIKTKFEDDRVKKKETETSHLEYWYGNNFFAYGVQKVHNQRQTGGDVTRKVFFINKITCTTTTN